MGNNIFPGREILPEILPLQTTDKHHRQQLDWQGRTSAQPVSDNLTIWHGVSFSGEILSRSIFYQSVSVQEPRHSFYYFKNISLRFCFPNVLNLLIKFEAFTKLDWCSFLDLYAMLYCASQKQKESAWNFPLLLVRRIYIRKQMIN